MNATDARPRKQGRRKVLLIAGAFLLVAFCAACIVAKIGYDICFQRSWPPADSLRLRYEDVDPGAYPRTAVSFTSGGNRLNGHVYHVEDARGMVVISHGLGAGAESYFPETRFFVDNGWQVFAFDNTGSHHSEGDSTRGISQSVLDLDAVLRHIEGDPTLNDLPVVLYGHSWGGYAVAAVLNLGHPVAAVASVAGYSTPAAALYDFAENRTGIFGVLAYPLFWGYHNILYGSNANISAIDGLNRSGVPALVIHGTGDNTIRPDVSGILARQADITNPNVGYIKRDAENQNGHSNAVYSQRANMYTQEKTDEWAELESRHGGALPDEARQTFYGGVDKSLSSELDPLLFARILELFEQAVA